jgi:hypothetical protein
MASLPSEKKALPSLKPPPEYINPEADLMHGCKLSRVKKISPKAAYVAVSVQIRSLGGRGRPKALGGISSQEPYNLDQGTEN